MSSKQLKPRAQRRKEARERGEKFQPIPYYVGNGTYLVWRQVDSGKFPRRRLVPQMVHPKHMVD